MNKTIKAGNREIGPGHPAYLIAEMSGNHNGDFNKAIELIYAAKESGADAVKLQTYSPETMTIKCDNDYFKVKGGTLWDGSTLHDLYASAMTPWDWQPKIFEKANDLGLDCFSTPFDTTSLEFLEELNPIFYKIASFEIVDIPLLKAVASKGRPIIMSTGMSTLEEVTEAVETVRSNGCRDLVLLKCVSSYPAIAEDMHLRTIPHLAETFDCLAGLSDHSMDLAVPISAVTLGACMVEKHFTLSRKDKGPDSDFSLEPDEFKLMVENIRIAEKSLGKISYQATAKENSSLIFRRSIFAVEDIKENDLLTEKNIRVIRPGYGLHPRHMSDVLGKRIRKSIKKGQPLSWEIFE